MKERGLRPVHVLFMNRLPVRNMPLLAFSMHDPSYRNNVYRKARAQAARRGGFVMPNREETHA
jgi:hypothetical protein